MISRYALYDIQALRDRFALVRGVPKGVKPHYNISPASEIPVVVVQGGVGVMERMLWGLVPPGAKDTNSVFRYKTFAVRSETILAKPLTRHAIRTQRCLIPANGWYDWKRLPDQKRPFYLHSTTQPLAGLAGIYSEWTDPAGSQHATCAIITIDSEAIDDMTPRRLPVIVEPAAEADWLNPTLHDLSTLFGIMRPYDLGQLEIIPVGEAINSSKPDTPELIRRLVR